MGSKTLTISLPAEMLGFLEENPALSPSKLFQGAVENIQNSLKNNPQLIEANKTISQLEKARDKIKDMLQEATEFITLKGLWDNFLKEYPAK